MIFMTYEEPAMKASDVIYVKEFIAGNVDKTTIMAMMASQPDFIRKATYADLSKVQFYVVNSMIESYLKLQELYPEKVLGDREFEALFATRGKQDGDNKEPEKSKAEERRRLFDTQDVRRTSRATKDEYSKTLDDEGGDDD